MPRRDLNHDLRLLTRAARSHIITLPHAALVLGLQQRPATIRMSNLAAKGWVRRIRRGVFLLIPVNAPYPQEECARDPETLAEALFAPCYLGGWSAAAHNALPSVKRRGIFIATGARVRRTSVRTEGFRYHLVHVPPAHAQGPGLERLGLREALVSGYERTIVDALNCPHWLGGAIYLGDALKKYRLSPCWDEDRFAEVLETVGTGAAHKRLGMLVDAKGLPTLGLLRRAVAGRTSGVIDLDPGAPSQGPIHSFWGVRRNVDLEEWDYPDKDATEDDFIEGVDDPDP